MTIEELVPRVRQALSVSDTYDAEVIPYGIQRQMTRLLRDYHFPWSVRREIYAPAANQQDYTLPANFKKELMLYFADVNTGGYGEPLGKREGFTLPPSDGEARHYWVWQGKFSTDLKVPVADASTTRLILWYESMGWEDNEEWLLERFEDMVFTLSTFRLAAELNKKELAEIYGALWADDRQALAIYLNELEFDNGVYVQREAVRFRTERYPVS